MAQVSSYCLLKELKKLTIFNAILTGEEVGKMSKIFISLAAVTGVLVFSVAFLMWGYFDSQARMEEHEAIIAEQGVLIEQYGAAIQELVSAVAEHDQDIDKLL